MSRLTASPFHKPSPFEFPHPVHPISPPDTDSEVGAPVLPSVLGSNQAMLGVEFDQATTLSAGQSETPTARFKRVSTLAYHNSGHRESRERSIQRSSKSLVVVIPPGSFSQQHGQLGHTLSSGPQSRLSNGILMPLFPTMYGQLTAIAREFNFPSTAGVCLYLHLSEGGMTVTPRISDDSWQFLWGHLDGSSPTSVSRGLPICGRIEFDIDLTKARWYTSWVSGPHKDAADSIAPSRAPSMSHWRGDSKTSFADEQGTDESSSGIQQTRIPASTVRHVPRKLSLVGRFESSSVHSMHSASKSVSQPGISPEVNESQTIPVLSPIVQKDEPQTAKQILERRVNNWRVSASVSATPKAPAMPPIGPVAENAQIDDVLASAEKVEPELNLDDFTWSVSSAGPPSPEFDSPLSPYRLPSVNLDRRIEEAVCMTPSVCTSFGPFDYDLHSPMTDISLLPSLDIGQRMVEDCPPTPSVCTSFGPFDYDLHSPMTDVSRVPSLDIGQRIMEDCPPTPSTATSWGPQSWPPSPLSDYRAPSIHLAERGDFSRPVTPSTATTWGCLASYPPSPTTPFYTNTPDVGQRAFDPDDIASRLTAFVFPYYDAFKGTSWKKVWPYHQGSGDLSREANHDREKYSQNEFSYPYLTIYPAVYPCFDVYPIISGFAADALLTAKSVSLPAIYPVFDLYPACYPHFDIYRPLPEDAGAINEKSAVVGKYTESGIVYPHFDIYPEVRQNRLKCAPPLSSEALPAPSVKIVAQYPNFDLYPSVYPFITPYLCCDIMLQSSATNAISPLRPLSVEIERAYPIFDIYPTVYPGFDIYPDNSLINVNSGVEHISIDCLSVQLGSSYPNMSIYTAVYPYLEIYPSVYAYESEGLDVTNHLVTSTTAYPIFCLYPAVYPYFDIYPSQYIDSNGPSQVDSYSARLEATYPTFNLYPAVYPHFDIYPGDFIASRSGADMQTTTGAIASLPTTPKYPVFSIYPAVYPFFDLYPQWCTTCNEKQGEKQGELITSISTKLRARYPALNIYSYVYPHFDLYPSDHVTISPRLQSRKPSIVQGHILSTADNHITDTRLIVANPNDETSPKIETPRRLSRNRVSFAPEASSISPEHSNSSSITEAPKKPIIRVIDTSAPPINRTASTNSLSPPSASRRAPPQTSGLPSNPAAARRSMLLRPAPPLQRMGHPTSEHVVGPQERPKDQVDANGPKITENDGPRRSSSMIVPPRDPAGHHTAIDRTRSLTSKPPTPRKRDSLVLQRVKAYDSSSSHQDSENSRRLDSHTLSQFPMPPLPPMPSRKTPLN